MNNKIEQMKNINKRLIEAADAYYNTDKEIMSNYEYDKLYDELVSLENETGVVLSDSITNKVGFEVVDSLKKSEHKHPALSLSKTKDPSDISSLLSGDTGCMSWKLDGLTVVLTYENHILKSAVTRGDGIIGEDITEQARRFANIPLKIPFSGDLIVRGEAVISYDEFERINNNAVDGVKFKNPRNLVSGTVKSLDLSVLDERRVNFVAFTLVEGNLDSYNDRLDWLSSQGFEVVEHILVNESNLKTCIDNFTKKVEAGYKYPVDGLVVYIDDIKKQNVLGDSTHHPRYAIAFKWQDETKKTILREIEWSKSRTGRINPVAIFDPVELEGTTVSRASLHNLSYIDDMKLKPGDEICVFKANMIIPQIAENITKSLKNIDEVIPDECPVCGHKTEIVGENDSLFLICTNKDCGENVDSIVLFMKTLKIMNISKKTVVKLIDNGLISCREDIFNLKCKREEFISIDNIGEKKFDSLIEEINNVNPTIGQFIASLGIKGVSSQNANVISKNIDSIEDFVNISFDELKKIDGVGSVIARDIVSYNNEHKGEILKLASHVNFKNVEVNNDSSISGKTFAITGTVEHFKNRKELQSVIEQNGGKVSGVSSSTDYLITNDPNSGSSKNKKAQELGVKIITEEEFIEMVSQGD